MSSLTEFEKIEEAAHANKSAIATSGPLKIICRNVLSHFGNHLHFYWEDEEISRVDAIGRYEASTR